MEAVKTIVNSKTSQVTLFASTAIALYGYDQGMMSLINTNYNYLATMGITEEDPLVGIIVSVYYLGCAVGAVLASMFADKKGRKPSIFACLAVSSLGNLIMFFSGFHFKTGAIGMMFVGRIVMGLGVGGIDSVIPTYSSELNEDGGRGRAMAQEFQSNIFGLNMAFAINLLVTYTLGKSNQWAWRLPILIMQVYPVLLLAFISILPESPRWCIHKNKVDKARHSLALIYGEDDADSQLKDLKQAAEDESSNTISYADMVFPSGKAWHPTVVTIMGQVNQALTGYGAVSVYGPQIFELLGFSVLKAEYITLGNYVSYFALMTFAWLLIDRIGRRVLMVAGSFAMAVSFLLLTLLGGLAMNNNELGIPKMAVAIPGVVILYLATGAFGIGWLTQPWLIPTEIYPSSGRAQGAAVSVIVWGLMNFAVTLLTPIGFNNLHYWLFLVFAVTNLIAGWWTYVYCPESGGRAFEENQAFFQDAKEHGTWRVKKVNNGEFQHMPKGEKSGDDETMPLLGGGRDD